MPNTFASLASQVFADEFGSQTGFASHSQISGWFATHLGDLNTLLHANFTGVDPSLDTEASGIYKKLYMHAYYRKASRNALQGVMNDGGVLSISDGDYKIAFANRKEVAKEYRGLANELLQEVQQDAYRYSLYEANPKQLGGVETALTGVYSYVSL